MIEYIKVKMSDFFTVQKSDRYAVHIEYTDGTTMNSYCLGWSEQSAMDDLQVRMRAGVFNRVRRTDGFIELKQIKAYKLGEVQK